MPNVSHAQKKSLTVLNVPSKKPLSIARPVKWDTTRLVIPPVPNVKTDVQAVMLPITVSLTVTLDTEQLPLEERRPVKYAHPLLVMVDVLSVKPPLTNVKVANPDSDFGKRPTPEPIPSDVKLVKLTA